MGTQPVAFAGVRVKVAAGGSGMQRVCGGSPMDPFMTLAAATGAGGGSSGTSSGGETGTAAIGGTTAACARPSPADSPIAPFSGLPAPPYALSPALPYGMSPAYACGFGPTGYPPPAYGMGSWPHAMSAAVASAHVASGMPSRLPDPWAVASPSTAASMGQPPGLGGAMFMWTYPKAVYLARPGDSPGGYGSGVAGVYGGIASNPSNMSVAAPQVPFGTVPAVAHERPSAPAPGGLTPVNTGTLGVGGCHGPFTAVSAAQSGCGGGDDTAALASAVVINPTITPRFVGAPTPAVVATDGAAAAARGRKRGTGLAKRRRPAATIDMPVFVRNEPGLIVPTLNPPPRAKKTKPHAIVLPTGKRVYACRFCAFTSTASASVAGHERRVRAAAV